MSTILINNTKSYPVCREGVTIMSKIALEADMVRNRLLEIAQQAQALAAGLQNAAPGDKDKPNPSIQYLIAASDMLLEMSEQCGPLADRENTKRPGSPG